MNDSFGSFPDESPFVRTSRKAVTQFRSASGKERPQAAISQLLEMGVGVTGSVVSK